MHIAVHPWSARIISFAVVALAVAACGGSTLNNADDADGGAGDAGGCATDPPPTHCFGICGDSNGGSVVCIDGAWQCPGAGSGSCDAGSFDAGRSDAGTIACGSETCNANTEYCDIRGGGPPLLDGGTAGLASTCMPLPAMPCEAGTGCDCIPNRCSCNDNDGAITNECLFP